MSANDELKDAVSAMYQMALQGCTTREECMDVRKDVRRLTFQLDRIADEDCWDRAAECDKEQAK